MHDYERMNAGASKVRGRGYKCMSTGADEDVLIYPPPTISATQDRLLTKNLGESLGSTHIILTGPLAGTP